MRGVAEAEALKGRRPELLAQQNCPPQRIESPSVPAGPVRSRQFCDQELLEPGRLPFGRPKDLGGGKPPQLFFGLLLREIARNKCARRDVGRSEADIPLRTAGVMRKLFLFWSSRISTAVLTQDLDDPAGDQPFAFGTLTCSDCDFQTPEGSRSGARRCAGDPAVGSAPNGQGAR
jgi:hypothetical protein